MESHSLLPKELCQSIQKVVLVKPHKEKGVVGNCFCFIYVNTFDFSERMKWIFCKYISNHYQVHSFPFNKENFKELSINRNKKQEMVIRSLISKKIFLLDTQLNEESMIFSWENKKLYLQKRCMNVLIMF